MKTAILLVTHGTVSKLDDLVPFVTNIRRGHPPPPALITELERRYRAIGGSSPLMDISRSLAAKVETKTGCPTRVASRLWDPYPAAVLGELAPLGISRVISIPLAQYSTHVYRECVEKAAAPLNLEVSYAANWGDHPLLVEAFAERIGPILEAARTRGKAELLFTAHSLPVSVIQAGDPYADEVRKSAAAIAARLSLPSYSLGFQSQGATTGPRGVPMEWLGPDLQASLRDAKERGVTELVVAPIGFLADHVEVLFDLDIEARDWAAAMGIHLTRIPSLNDGDALVRVVADIAAQFSPEVS